MKKNVLLTTLILFTLFLFGCDQKVEESDSYSKKQSSIEKVKYLETSESVEVESVSKSKEVKTIVIDPGHSSVGNREKEPTSPGSSTTKTKDVLGATGVSSNIPEHVTTILISSLLKDKLVNMGFNVVMTKSTVEESISNIERAKVGNDNNADLVIRIHADSSDNQQVHGASILVPSESEYTNDISSISNDYAENIIDIYTKELGIKNRGVIYRDDMTGFNWSDVPVVILEMGFLSNIEEDNFLSNKNNHDAIASAIANGIKYCFK